PKPASLAVRLRGTRSNRDAVGARVTVETDRVRITRIVHAGSGFLSQHSKELLIGLGASERVSNLTVSWPSGATQVFTDVPVNTRIRIVEGGDLDTEALKPRTTGPTTLSAPAPALPLQAAW